MRGLAMKILLGGIIVLVIGLVGLAAWWADFLLVMKGSIPIVLVLGGALAIYLGAEDLKSSAAQKKEEAEKTATEKTT